jgi:hypothetical protein
VRRTVAASILFSASLLAGDARAGATVDLLFVGRNGGPVAPTDTVVALPGDTLRMALRVRNDQSFSMTFFSLSYDLDEGDELDVVSAVEWAGLPFFGPPCSLCFPPASTSTFVGPFRGQMRSTGGLPLPVAGGAFAGGYQVGTVVWNVNAGVNDHGADIISGLPFGTEYGFFDAAFNNVTHSVLFRSATVNFVPEPGTVLLLGLGLLAVALRQRRR